MKSEWTPWYRGEDIERFQDSYGVYELKLVNRNGRTYPLERLCGRDPNGILYIGRSGYLEAKTRRTLKKRISEFFRGYHSGGNTFELVRKTKRLGWLSQKKPWESYIRFRVIEMDGQQDKIDQYERESLARYFVHYGELPPCNSAIPGKSDRFYDLVEGLIRSGVAG